jgi:hypothetical protein
MTFHGEHSKVWMAVEKFDAALNFPRLLLMGVPCQSMGGLAGVSFVFL